MYVVYVSPNNYKIREHTFTRLPREMNVPMTFAIKESKKKLEKSGR